MLPAVLMDTLSGRGGEWSSFQASSQEHPRLFWGPEAWAPPSGQQCSRPCGSAPEGPHPAPACLNPDPYRAGSTLGRGSAGRTPCSSRGHTDHGQVCGKVSPAGPPWHRTPPGKPDNQRVPGRPSSGPLQP